MRDLICKPELRELSQQRGYEPLILGEDFSLCATIEDVRKATTPIKLATATTRNLIEADIDGVVLIEEEAHKDHLHYRRAGLEQVNARILAENGKYLVVSYAMIRYAKDAAKILGRVQQNVRIARKFGVEILFVTMATEEKHIISPHDLKAFFESVI